MSQEPYLLTLRKSTGGNDFLTRHIIRAEDAQMVKYHYHRTLKDWGWNDTRFGIHCLEGPYGLHADIHRIDPLSTKEFLVMEKFLGNWTKV